MGDIQSDMSPVGDGGGEEDLLHIYIYTMGNIQSDMSPVTDGGGEDLCYVHSGGRSVTHVPKRGMGE